MALTNSSSGTPLASTSSTPGLRGGAPVWVPVAFTAGLLLVFLGERVLSTIGWMRNLLTGVGVLAVLTVSALRWLAVRATEGGRRSAERALAILATFGTLGVLLYLTTAEPFDTMIGLPKLAIETRHRYESLATIAWIVLVLASLIPTLFAERALYPMRRAERIEWRRVRSAMLAGLTLALAATYGTLFTFAAGETDVKADFSYFQTARPSETTRKIVASAAMPIRIVAFFPDLSEVGVEAGGFVRSLASGQPNVRAERHDRLLVPDLARDLKVTEDGVIVVEYGAERTSLSIGTELQAAQPKLKTLDGDFQKALLGLMREKRTAYFTGGHGELSDAQPKSENDGRTGKAVRHIIEQQSYSVRDLGAVTGLGMDVPDDAKLLVVLGPSQPFLPEEVAAVDRYAKRGGKMLFCLDPDGKADLEPLASLVGLTVSKSVLANEKFHLRRHYNDSDNTIIATNRYSSHASVSTLSRLSSHPVFFLGAGALDKAKGDDPALKIDFTVRSLPDTFEDKNGNFHFDAPAEKREAYPVAAAVNKVVDASTKAEMRAFVIADADALSDAALSNEANVVFVADGVRWLGGEESFAGAMETPEDVRIEHTKQKDLIWFYGGIFGAPAVILTFGLWYTQGIRRAKKRKRTKGQAPSPEMAA